MKAEVMDMNEVLSLAEIRARFPGQWVLLEDPEMDKDAVIKKGKFIYSSEVRDAVYGKAKELNPKRPAILYVKAPPVVRVGFEEKIVVKADPDSIRSAMDLAWRDHHHMREQTWKALQIEAVLAAGLVGVDWQIQNAYATFAAGILVVIAAFFGILITLHHREAEIRKFTHIVNCEEMLGLHRDDLLHPGSTNIPRRIRFIDIFNPKVQNTAIFILRMHVALMSFAALYVIARLAVELLKK